MTNTPWTDTVYQTNMYTVYNDGYPVTEGHLLFVPKVDNEAYISRCLTEAYLKGQELISQGKCDGFNIGMNVGDSAGQTVMYPHIHLIPRRSGDMEDPRGGVRHVIPEKGNYKKDEDTKPIIDEVVDVIYGDGC